MTENQLSGQPQNYQNTYNIITSYGYDSLGRQTIITDTLGNVTRTFYDAAGRVDSQVVNYVSTINGGHFDPASPDRNSETQYIYDKNGNVLQTILLPGSAQQRVTCTVYDELNRVEQTLENCINGVHDGGDGPDQDVVTSYEYDSVGNQITVTAPLNRITRYDYDRLNRVITMTNPLLDVTTYAYDPAGNRIRVTEPSTVPGQPSTRFTLYEYDALNRVVTTTNALGGQAIVTYDKVGNQKKLMDANNNPLTYTYDSMYRLTATTDAENLTFSYTYDALGNKLTQSDPLSRITRYEYDTLNRLITTTQNYVSGAATSPITNVRTIYAYDALGNRASLKDPNGNTTSYGYDKLNRLTTVQRPTLNVERYGYDGLGNRVSLTNGLSQTTVYGYDGLNRLTLIRTPLNRETTYEYNLAGERVATIDPSSVRTTYEYDALGRLTAVIENNVSSPSGNDQNVTTRYGYDAVGNRTVITNANLQVTTYQYDALNRLTSVTDPAPLNFITRYGYDALGNRKAITDASSAVTIYNYDKIYRLTGIDYPASMTDVSFTYDKLGHKLTMIDATGTTTYTYDALYRLTASRNGAGQLVQYGYDAAGNRNRLTYPGNKVITYTYDTANRLLTAQDWSSGRYTYTYDAADRLTNLRMVNGGLGTSGITSTYAYDADGRLTRLAHTVITGELAIYDYNLDVSGNRKRVTETLVAPAGGPPPGSFFASVPPLDSQPSVTPTLLAANPISNTLPGQPIGALYLPLVLKGSSSTSNLQSPISPPSPLSTSEPSTSNLPPSTLYLPLIFRSDDSLFAAALTGAGITRTIVYTYDKLYRLTDAGYSSGEVYAYSYDPAGNRRSQTTLGQTTVYTYDAANRIANANTQAYTWSNTGNLLNTGVLTNTFDAANRLTSANRLTHTLSITYDGLNNRVRQTSGTSTTTYALDTAAALPEVISTTNGTAYLHLPGVIVAQNAQGQRVYLLPDGLGSVRQVVSGTSVIAWRDYDPYGQVRASDPFTNTFDTSLEGWAFDSAWDIPAVLSNPPGVMRLAATQTSPPGHYNTITVKKLLNGGMGALTVSTVFTTYSGTTVQLWVAYADGSTETIYSYGTTPSTPYRHVVSYNTHPGKTPVALYFYAAASWFFPPFQVDIDTISAVPAASSPPVPTGLGPTPYAFTGEWWEQDVKLLHLRARWYDASSGVFVSKDPWPGDERRPQSLNGWNYVEGNPVNRVDPSGQCYGPASFLRSVPGERMLCENLDLAITIYVHPQATFQQKQQASAYITLWWVGHASGVAGLTFLGLGEFIELGRQADEIIEDCHNSPPLPGDLPRPLPTPQLPPLSHPPDPGGQQPLDPNNPLGGEGTSPPQQSPPGGQQFWGDLEECQALGSIYEATQEQIVLLQRDIIVEQDELERAILESQLLTLKSLQFRTWLEYESKSCRELTGSLPPPL